MPSPKTLWNSYVVARQVLTAFVGPKPHGLECCHLDDDPFNNALANLRWDTHSGNMKDRARNSGRWGGEKGGGNGRAKLTDAKVVLARLLHSEWPNTWTKEVMAELFGVTRQAVNQLITRRTWSHLP